MLKIYCNVCNRYRKFENLKILFFKTHYVFGLFTLSVVMNTQKIFTDKESIEILKLLIVNC